MLVVDGDGHVSETEAELRRRLAPEWARRKLLYPEDGFDRSLGGALGKFTATPEMHLQDMDLEGIDVAVLYPTQGLAIGEVREREYAIALSRAYNDWLHDYCAADPERLKGVALVPLQDVDAACREINRAVTDLGMVGAMFPTYFRYAPRSAGDPCFDPFFAECERLGVPVAYHANGHERGEARFDTFLGLHLFSHVPEQMISLTNVVLGGVLERFPRLVVGFMEAGCGWLPFWMEHMDDEYKKRQHEAPLLQMDPSEYIKSGRVYVGCEPAEKMLPIAAQWIGEGQLLYASDYPHWDSDWPHTVRTVWDRTDISEELKRKLLGENALRFYRLSARVVANAKPPRRQSARARMRYRVVSRLQRLAARLQRW
jgi:predicted TIM-barrel fold metal-dependent hydrolase